MNIGTYRVGGAEIRKLDNDGDGYLTEEEISKYEDFGIRENNIITDYSDLANLTGLKYVDIINNADIDSISLPKSITSLSIYNTKINGNLDISSCSNLETLSLHNSPIQDAITGLEDKEISYLYIDGKNSCIKNITTTLSGEYLSFFSVSSDALLTADITAKVSSKGEIDLRSENFNLNNLKITVNFIESGKTCTVDLRGVNPSIEYFDIICKGETGKVKLLCLEYSNIYKKIKDNPSEYSFVELDETYTDASVTEAWFAGEQEITLAEGEEYVHSEPRFYNDDHTPIKTAYELEVDDSNGVIEYDPETRKITAMKHGTARISVYPCEGGASASLKVVVRDQVTNIDVKQDNVTLKPGSSTTLSAQLTPSKDIVTDVWWKVYTKKGERVTEFLTATQDGLSIKKGKASNGLAKATFTAKKNVRPGEYIVTASSMSNYKYGTKGTTNEEIIDQCNLTIPYGYSVKVDKPIYYHSESDRVSKITVSNYFDINSISMEMKEPNDINDPDETYLDYLDFKQVPGNRAQYQLTFKDGHTDAEIREWLLSHNEVTIIVHVDGDTKEQKIGLNCFSVDSNVNKTEYKDIFGAQDTVEYDINSDSDDATRKLTIKAGGSKGAVTMTCDNANIGTFSFDKTTKTATLNISRNVENTATITISADGQKKYVKLNIFKKPKIQFFTEYPKEIIAYADYSDGNLVLDESSMPDTIQVFSDIYSDGEYQYLPSIVPVLGEGTAVLSSVEISNNSWEDGYTELKINPNTNPDKKFDSIRIGISAEDKDDNWEFSVYKSGEQYPISKEIPKDEISDVNRGEDVPENDGTPRIATWEVTIPVKIVGKLTDAHRSDIFAAPLLGDKKVAAAYVVLNDKKKYTLNDVELPDGWEFVNKNETLKANNSMPIQNFEVRYIGENGEYEDFEGTDGTLPIAVTQVKGIQIAGLKKDGDGNYTVKLDSLLNTQDAKCSVQYKCTGYNDATDTDFMEAVAKSFKLSWGSSDKTGKLSVTPEGANPEKATVISTYGNAKDNKVNITLTAVDKQNKKLTAKYPVTLTTSVIEEIVVKNDDGEIDENTFSIPLQMVEDALKNKIKPVLPVTVTVDSETLAGLVKWTSTNTAVAGVKETKDGNIEITCKKKAGKTIIRGVAKDAGKCTVEFPVEIIDYAPVLKTTKITINKYGKAPTTPIVEPQNGNTIISAMFVNANGEAEEDEIYEVADISAEGDPACIVIRVKEGAEDKIVNKKTVKKKLRVNASGKCDTCTDYNIQITGSTELPKVTVSQPTKARLFDLRKGDDLKFTLKFKSKTPITKVTLDGPLVSAGDFDVSLVGFDASTQVATFKYENVKSDTTAEELSKALNLIVEYSGLEGEYPVTTAKIKYDKGPKTAASEVKVDFVKSMQPGAKEFTFIPKDKKGNLVIDKLSSGTVKLDSASVKAKFDEDGVYNPEDGSITIKYNGDKKAKFTLTVSSQDVYGTYTVKGSVSEAKAKEIAISNSKLTLNVYNGTGYNKNSFVETPLCIKNDEFATIEKVYYGTDSKSKVVFESGYIDVVFNKADQTIKVKKTSLGTAPKAGTYKIYLKGLITVDGKQVETKLATLTLVLSGKAPSLTAKASGGIKYGKADSSVTFTMKVAETSSKLASFKLNSSSAALFNAAFDAAGGKVVITPKDSNVLRKKEYKLGGTFTLEDGTVINWDGASKGKYLSVKVK